MTENNELPTEPRPGEVWHQTPSIRWVTMKAVPLAPKILQTMWMSNYGRHRWVAVETVLVDQSEYEERWS